MYKALIYRTDSNEHRAIQMLQKAEEVNVVYTRIEAENLLTRRGSWVALTEAHFPLFSQLEEQFLRNYNFGSYQVYLPPSYIQDILLRADTNTEGYAIKVDALTNENGFMRVRIFSRFRNSLRHQLWIAFH